MQTITAENYDDKIQRISDLMEENPEAGTPDADELQELATALEAYEQTLNLAVNAPVAVAETEKNPTHILFYYDLFLGKSKEMSGDYQTLRAWANKQHEQGNIRGGWEIERLS